MNLLPLLLNRYVIGGVAAMALVAGVFWAGDHYGFNAHRYANCKTETARRNAAIAAVNRSEDLRHAQEEERRAHASQAFANCPDIQSCILTKETAQCLDLLME